LDIVRLKRIVLVSNYILFIHW